MKHKERSDVFVREAIQRIAREKSVLDVGGGIPFGKWMKEYEPLFKDSDYRTFDYDTTTGADVVGDIHAIPLPDASVDAVICSSVLEHVRDPLLAMKEIKRILRHNGKLFLYVPSTYPYHAHKGHYPDYWRIFDDTLALLLEGYSSVSTCKRGGYFMALSFFVPMQHKLRWFLTPVADFFDVLFRTDRRSTTAGYYVYATK